MNANNKYLKAILISLFFISGDALSESLPLWGNESLPPMSYIENDTPKGFGIEITQLVLKEAGIDFRFKLAPWKRAYMEALRGNGLVFGMYWTPDRAKKFNFSKPLWSEEIVIATQRGNEFKFEKIDDLKGKKISMQRGTRPGSEFENALKNKLFIAMPNNSPVERIDVLMHGQVDAGIFNPGLASVIWNAKLAGVPIQSISILKKPLAIKDKHIAIARFLNREDLIKKIDAAIDRLNAQGQIQAIIGQYESM